jgi:hypothetical protein
MKTFLKIAGVILVVFTILLAYFAYNAVSDMRQVHNIIEASAEYYNQHQSFENFCEHPTLKDAKAMGFEVSCQEGDGEITLKLNTKDLEYFCKPARIPDTKKLACVELDLPEDKGAETSSQSLPNRFNVNSALPTLDEKPPLCAQKDNLLYVANKVEYAVMPGVYSSLLREDERASLFTIAINNDRTICSCEKKKNPDEVVFFDYGMLNDQGYIEWDEERSWPSKKGRLDRFNQSAAEATAKNPDIGYGRSDSSIYGIMLGYNSVITTVGETTSGAHMIKLPADGCVSSWTNLYPVDGIMQNEVCGCDGRGVN